MNAFFLVAARCVTMTLCALYVAMGLGGAARAADLDAGIILDRARQLELEGMALLNEHYLLEESLFSEGSDRLLIFMSMPHGARLILEEVNVFLNNKPVGKFTYSVSELMLLQGRAVQLLHVARIPLGDYTLRLDVKAVQGRLKPMQPYTFTKGVSPKFIEIELAGSQMRQVEVTEW